MSSSFDGAEDALAEMEASDQSVGRIRSVLVVENLRARVHLRYVLSWKVLTRRCNRSNHQLHANYNIVEGETELPASKLITLYHQG